MSVASPGGGRRSLIISAVTKPELYFQPEVKQKGRNHGSAFVPDAGDQAALQSLEVCTAGCHTRLKRQTYGSPATHNIFARFQAQALDSETRDGVSLLYGLSRKWGC